MASRRTVKDQNSKPSQYRLPIIVGAVGVILLVLGYIIPFQGWNNLLFFLGLIILFAVVFIIRLWFIGDWTPKLFERDGGDDLPPPPTAEW